MAKVPFKASPALACAAGNERQRVKGSGHRGYGYLGKSQWERRYGAIVLFSTGAPLWIPLGKANEIERLVRRYGALVRGSPEEDELSANLQALYEALWAPIQQALPSQTKRIIISPDGQLNFISFTTLLTRDKQFLAQTYDVQYVASRRDLLRELKPSIASEVVLFADPDFGLVSTPMLAEANNRSSDPGSESIRGSEKRDIEDWSFGSLGGTQKERDELIKGGGWGQVKYRCMVLQLIFDLSPSSSSVSVTLQRPSTRCLSVGNIASQVGVSTATIARACARFREMAGLDSAGGVRPSGQIRSF